MGESTIPDRITLLADVAEIVSRSDGLDEMLANVVDLVGKRLDADACSLFLATPDLDRLRLVATVGLHREAVGRVDLRLDEGLVGLAAERKAPVAIERASEHPRYKYFPVTGEERFESLMAAPLIIRDVAIGVLAVQTVVQRSFERQDVDMLMTCAQLLAPVVLNAQLLTSAGHPSGVRNRQSARKPLASVFISYGGPDANFAALLNRRLTESGVKTYFFHEDALPGMKLHRLMREGVNNHDRVLLVCSQESLVRPGVMNELQEALQRESREGGSEVLIPLALDNCLFEDWGPADRGVAQALLDRVVADFRGAKEEPVLFDSAVEKLMSALHLGSQGEVSELDPIVVENPAIPEDNRVRALIEERELQGWCFRWHYESEFPSTAQGNAIYAQVDGRRVATFHYRTRGNLAGEAEYLTGSVGLMESFLHEGTHIDHLPYTVVLDRTTVRRSTIRIAHEIAKRRNPVTADFYIVGVRSCDAPVARSLAAHLGGIAQAKVQVGVLDSTLYHDEATSATSHPRLRNLATPSTVDGKLLVLVTTAMQTGRTVTNAQTILLGHFRPGAIQVATLIDCGGRLVPVKADYVGKNLPRWRGKTFHLRGDEHSLEIVVPK